VIDVVALVVGGKLKVRWTYGEELHERETIERLSQRFLARLQSLIAHCLSEEAFGYTPSDFPLARLDEEKLKDVSELIAEIDEAEER
jgi:non-ribosomal peptide synthase protein (TIGR01720 family)